MRRHTSLIGGLVGAVGLLTGLVISKTFDVLELEDAAYAVAVVILIVLGVIAITWLYKDQSQKEELEATLNTLRDITKEAKFSWLFHGRDILNIEKSTTAKDIWIISPHLVNDTSDIQALQDKESTTEAVRMNLSRGVTYTYIVPNSGSIKLALPVLRQNYSKFPDQIKTILIEPEIFENVAISEYVIYNPLRLGSEPTRVFIELPVVDLHLYWVEVVDSAAFSIVDQVTRIINDHKATHNEAT